VCGGVRNKTIKESLSSSHKFNRYKKVMYQEERKLLKVTFIVLFGVESSQFGDLILLQLRKMLKISKST
jgi:hypothetical protein